MIRINPPQCSGCGGVASYQSELWPSVMLCFGCIRFTSDWLLRNKLADENPFFFELVETGTEQIIDMFDGSSIMIVWGFSKHDDSLGVSGQHHVRFPKKYEDSC